jgi:hypothetical protein
MDNLPAMKQLPSVDTVSAIRPMLNVFNSITVPGFVAIFLLFAPTGTTECNIPLVSYASLLSTISVLIMIFVHWRKGPKWWTTYSPKIYYLLLVMVFILIPVVCLANMTVIFVMSDNFKLVRVFAFFFTVTFLVRPVEFYGLIWKTVGYEAKFFLNIKSQNLNVEEL